MLFPVKPSWNILKHILTDSFLSLHIDIYFLITCNIWTTAISKKKEEAWTVLQVYALAQSEEVKTFIKRMWVVVSFVFHNLLFFCLFGLGWTTPLMHKFAIGNTVIVQTGVFVNTSVHWCKFHLAHSKTLHRDCRTFDREDRVVYCRKEQEKPAIKHTFINP